MERSRVAEIKKRECQNQK